MKKKTLPLSFLENALTNVSQIFFLGLGGNSPNPEKTHSFNLECWLLEYCWKVIKPPCILT